MNERETCRARQCGEKIRHPNRRVAKQAMRDLSRRAGVPLSKLGTYRCPWCWLWHVGNDRYWDDNIRANYVKLAKLEKAAS